MGNPLSHVGQTARPEISEEVEKQCEQVQNQRQQQQSGQSQSQEISPGASDVQSADTAQPATRLLQHPQQHQGAASDAPGEQTRIRQQSDTSAEDTTLPSPTQAD